jgi:hypothetical protein
MIANYDTQNQNDKRVGMLITERLFRQSLKKTPRHAGKSVLVYLRVIYIVYISQTDYSVETKQRGPCD